MSSSKPMNVEDQIAELSFVSRKVHDTVERFERGEVKREDADTIINGHGKNLKALALLYVHTVRADELRGVERRAEAALAGRGPLQLDKTSVLGTRTHRIKDDDEIKERTK